MIPLIAVAGLALAGLVLTVFWKEIKDFIQASVKKIGTSLYLAPLWALEHRNRKCCKRLG